MDREIERKISSGETPMSDNPGLPGKEEDEFDNSFAELLRLKDLKKLLRRLSDIQVWMTYQVKMRLCNFR